eukprot:TRINITY_DN3767_c0_g2_i2.p1 TRINITY_DN3767_c0_g2~~TRINITY_DN3767_c0_g2_i2.p1  ORF type:complete len:271 (-),score=44.11 TRINITY_DN3767_c0_g2_i2:68-880(-)
MAKVIEKSTLAKSQARQRLISEIKIHRSLKNENVVLFEHVFEDHENVYILQEICPNKTLNDVLKRRKRLHEIEVQSCLVQLINGLKYLHDNRIIHRDLKLGNLLISETMELKIGDFSLATKLEYEGERKRTICGTSNYLAPEILQGKNGYSYEVDIWSLGNILYTLLIGTLPFASQDVKSTYTKIRNQDYDFPMEIPLSDSAKDMIRKILVVDPSQRPTLEDIMKHPFLNNGVQIPKLLPASILNLPPGEEPNSDDLKPSQVTMFSEGED